MASYSWSSNQNPAPRTRLKRAGIIIVSEWEKLLPELIIKEKSIDSALMVRLHLSLMASYDTWGIYIEIGTGGRYRKFFVFGYLSLHTLLKYDNISFCGTFLGKTGVFLFGEEKLVAPLIATAYRNVDNANNRGQKNKANG
jgi:hypothetical protein